jgi:hypothetical protein
LLDLTPSVFELPEIEAEIGKGRFFRSEGIHGISYVWSVFQLKSQKIA